MAWMCGLWDPRRNEYHPGQNWGYAEGEGNVWPSQDTEEAKACVEGLGHMLARLTSRPAISGHEQLTGGIAPKLRTTN